MPKYSYKCTKCEDVFFTYHSINDSKKNCPVCGVKNSLDRIPCDFSLYEQKEDNKVGSLVNKSIEDFREDLESEKGKLKNEFFKPDK